MSTFEIDALPVGTCPCGKGKIIFSVTPRDKAWGSANSHPFIDCPTCKMEWTITTRGLVDIQSQQLYEVARIEQLARGEELTAFTSDLMAGYFQTFAAAKMFAEWNEIAPNGVHRELFENVLVSRKHELANQIAQSPHNAEFLRKLATEAGQIDRLTLLLDAVHRASMAAEDAYRGIVRRELPEIEPAVLLNMTPPLS